MPKFKKGDPQVTYYKRNGSEFTKTYHSKSAAMRSVKAYKSAGGRVCCMDTFKPSRSKTMYKRRMY